jgi:hypothetical protein
MSLVVLCKVFMKLFIWQFLAILIFVAARQESVYDIEEYDEDMDYELEDPVYYKEDYDEFDQESLDEETMETADDEEEEEVEVPEEEPKKAPKKIAKKAPKKLAKKLETPQSHLNPYRYVLAMALTLLGLYTNLFGTDQTRVILFLYGSSLFVLVAFAIVQTVKNANGVVYAVSMLVSWLVGGFLFVWLQKVVSYIAAMFTGFVLSAAVFTYMVLPTWIKIIVGSVSVLVFAVVNHFFDLFFISTAVLGGFCFCTGLNLVFGWGFAEMLRIFWTERVQVSLPLMIVFLLMAVIGSLVQFLVLRNRKKVDEIYQPLNGKESKRATV